MLDILKQKDELAKYGVLFDEMYVKQDLVFEKFTGALFDFTDLGEVNKQLDEFEASLKNNALLLQKAPCKNHDCIYV